jgi:glycosyltransferase involved in cell wall biosynthesis
MARAFSDAPVHTSLYDPNGTFPEFGVVDVRTSSLDRIRALRQRHRLALPLLAPTFSAMQIEADVVVCSSSGWAHGVRTSGRKIVYCYAPARWLYQSDTYLAASDQATRAALRLMRLPLRLWDRRAAQSADVYLAISSYSRRLIWDTYQIEAEVLWPPSSIDARGRQEPIPGLEPGFYLCVSRLLAYKNVDAVLEAFRSLPLERVVIVGRGPEEAKLRQVAPPNATFLTNVSDEELRWLYAGARALIAASFEDFGLTPVEAATFGTPSIALRFGGYLDTVIEGETGVFFEAPEPVPIASAVRRLASASMDPRALQEHSRRFAEENFRSRMRELAGIGLPADVE